MNIREYTITEIIQRTPTVMSLRVGRDGFGDFQPGQFVQVFLAEDLQRYLSISSSPSKDYIEFTKRITDSDFSGALKALKAGDTIKIKGPFGKFVLTDELKKISFLVGGIGITPVISMLEHIDEQKPDISVNLLYSNRVVGDIAFKAELDRILADNPNIDIDYIITDEQADADKYICSLLNTEIVNKCVPDCRENVFFLCGPPKMVECMKEMLLSAGHDPALIRTENFIGY